MEPDYTEAQQIWDNLETLIKRVEALNQTAERSRSLSLVITNLENAQDKLRRHIVDGR